MMIEVIAAPVALPAVFSIIIDKAFTNRTPEGVLIRHLELLPTFLKLQL